MTSFSATQPAIERSELQRTEPNSTQLEVTVLPDKAPWLYSALGQLRELKNSGGIIRGFGDFRVSDQTHVNAKLLIARMGVVRDIPAPLVSVFSGGGVSLTWSLGDRELGFKIFPEGTIIATRAGNDDVIDSNEIALTRDEGQISFLVIWLVKPS